MNKIKAGLRLASAMTAMICSGEAWAATLPVCQGTIAPTTLATQPVSISISGNHLSYTNGSDSGAALVGINLRAFMTSHNWSLDQSVNAAPDDQGFYQSTVKADQRFNDYGDSILKAAKAWGANTVRFQVNQYYLADPNRTKQANKNDPNYLQCITNAVQMVRNQGMFVILAMQWQKTPNTAYGTAYPGNVTTSAWDILDDKFNGDNGVMYELYNEPGTKIYQRDADKNQFSLNPYYDYRSDTVSGTKGFWDKWHTTHQNLVDHLRGRGKANSSNKIFIVEGLDLGGSYQDLPATDRIDDSKTIYAVHPYPRGLLVDTSKTDQTETQAYYWQRRWGYLAADVPMMVTEWVQGADEAVADGSRHPEQIPELVNFIEQNNISYVPSAFDAGGVMLSNLDDLDAAYAAAPGTTFQPSQFEPRSYVSGSGKGGAGMLSCRFMQDVSQAGYQYGTKTYGVADITTTSCL